jgi:hypothetical protein
MILRGATSTTASYTKLRKYGSMLYVSIKIRWDERNHQVMLMSSIFHGADKVIIWLGKESPSCERAMDFVSKEPGKASKIIQPKYALAMNDVRATSESVENQIRSWNRCECEGLRIDEACIFETLWNLSRLPCWSRLWIVQEIMLAQELEILWGFKNISWSILKIVSANTMVPKKVIYFPRSSSI